jgi:hypothetical protein
VAYVPHSHPFVERLIATVRRGCLDHIPFWNARDLEKKLLRLRNTTIETVITERSEARHPTRDRQHQSGR